MTATEMLQKQNIMTINQ